jgi:hypothetical protein
MHPGEEGCDQHESGTPRSNAALFGNASRRLCRRLRPAPLVILDTLAVLVIGFEVVLIASHALGFAFGLLDDFLP